MMRFSVKTISYSDPVPPGRQKKKTWVTAGTTPRIWVATWAWALRLESRETEEFDLGGGHDIWISLGIMVRLREIIPFYGLN